MAELFALGAFAAVLTGTVALFGPWVACFVVGAGLAWAAWVAHRWDNTTPPGSDNT